MEKYYTIQQISTKTNISSHTLRYYEKIGLLMDIHRDQNGYRQYSQTDLSWIYFLVRLRETGMSIEDMKKFSFLRSKGESTITGRRELLELHQSKVIHLIQELQENLFKIEEKIDYYRKLEEDKIVES
jgi:DNA-binding transcriptional MerR regulator